MTYTYLIGWSLYDKWYYGVRFAKKCDPKELWQTYFTSSKHVKAFRKSYGEPDVIEIRKIFSCQDKAILWENKVLKRLDVIHKDKWLNKTDNIAIRSTEPRVYGAPWNKGKSTARTKESIEKQKITITGKKRGPYNILETDERLALRANISKSLKNNQRAKGVKFSEEEKIKRSVANIGCFWWTNGLIQVKSKICPPGFVRGKLKKR